MERGNKREREGAREWGRESESQEEIERERESQEERERERESDGERLRFWGRQRDREWHQSGVGKRE